MNCIKDRKLHLSYSWRSQALVGDCKRRAEIFGKEITWIFLVEKFSQKYILKIERDKLALAFQELKQGSMTIAQYDARFTQFVQICWKSQSGMRLRRRKRFIRAQAGNQKLVSVISNSCVNPEYGKSLRSGEGHARESEDLGQGNLLRNALDIKKCWEWEHLAPKLVVIWGLVQSQSREVQVWAKVYGSDTRFLQNAESPS